LIHLVLQGGEERFGGGVIPALAGQCYENAMIESFWSRMQVELLDRQRWHTRIELANAIFDYLEI
jgi:transposase InsO family protein